MSRLIPQLRAKRQQSIATLVTALLAQAFIGFYITQQQPNIILALTENARSVQLLFPLTILLLIIFEWPFIRKYSTPTGVKHAFYIDIKEKLDSRKKLFVLMKALQKLIICHALLLLYIADIEAGALLIGCAIGGLYSVGSILKYTVYDGVIRSIQHCSDNRAIDALLSNNAVAGQTQGIRSLQSTFSDLGIKIERLKAFLSLKKIYDSEADWGVHTVDSSCQAPKHYRKSTYLKKKAAIYIASILVTLAPTVYAVSHIIAQQLMLDNAGWLLSIIGILALYVIIPEWWMHNVSDKIPNDAPYSQVALSNKLLTIATVLHNRFTPLALCICMAFDASNVFLLGAWMLLQKTFFPLDLQWSHWIFHLHQQDEEEKAAKEEGTVILSGETHV